MKNLCRFAITLVCGFMLVGCGSEQAGAAEDVNAQIDNVEIVCHFFYRASEAKPDGQAKEITIKVPFMDAEKGIPEIGLNRSKRVEFEDITAVIQIQYNGMVIDAQDTETKKTVARVLYQFAGKPDNRLAGQHGFTGLHYVYHPESESHLQYWAVVKE